MLFLKIEEKYCYTWTCHVENCSGFILINMGFRKVKHYHAKYSLGFGNSIFRSKSQEKIMLLLRIESKISKNTRVL
jgi:hypothetical protein